MNKVIRVCKLVQDGDLTKAKVEKESEHIVGQLTSLRAFRSSLKHRVKTLSGGAADAEVAPVGLRRGEDD